MVLVEDFIGWMSHFENQSFNTLQSAYDGWLQQSGFLGVKGDYTTAVTVMLTYLSMCLANPMHRRYLSNPAGQPDEYTLLQVNVPELTGHTPQTFWEFLSQENFERAYREWLRWSSEPDGKR